MDEAGRQRLYGTTQDVPPSRVLRAGALRCEFSEGALRDIRWGEVEIVRGMSYLLRDRDWGTVPAVLGDVAVDESAERFELRFVLRMTTTGGTLEAVARIEGHADGHLLFDVTAVPDAAIETNRCGFVVLHPAAAAGRALHVGHTGGQEGEACFPVEISPSQPVLDIRSLSYSPAESIALRLVLEAELPGDPAGKFEMEDQRNWSDASFKTYVASLLDPWPYVLPADKALTQRVGLYVQGSSTGAARTASTQAAVRFGAAGRVRMPAIGIGVPAGVAGAGSQEKQALRESGAQWWIVEAALDDDMHVSDLAAVAGLRDGVDVRVRLDVIADARSSPEDCAALARQACDGAGLRVDAVRILARPYLKSFQPTDRWPDLPPLDAYAAAARAHFPGALVGGGMFTCFTELNRQRQPAEGLDFIGHATFPIVHAADDRSVMQTVESLAHMHRSVRRWWPGLAYHLGPSTLAMRRNPYGDLPAPNPRHERLALAAADPRHDGLFGASWTAAHVAAVAPLGIELLALHESHGPSGPFGRRAASAAAIDSAPVPAWAMLRSFACAAGSPLVPLEDLPDAVAGIAWQRVDGAIEGVVVNLGVEPRTLHWNARVEADGFVQGGPWKLGEFQAVRFVAPSA